MIGTDPSRSVGLSDRLVAHFNKTWLGAECPVERETRRVSGTPTRRDLGDRPLSAQRLGPDLARPACVVLPSRAVYPSAINRLRALQHDPCRLEIHRSHRRRPASTVRRSPFQAKFIVDTARFGMNNGGHTFGDDLSEDERMDLIEYLKTL